MEFDREKIGRQSTDIIEKFIANSADDELGHASRAVKYTIARFLVSYQHHINEKGEMISSYELTNAIRIALQDCLDEVNKAIIAITAVTTETIQ